MDRVTNRWVPFVFALGCSSPSSSELETSAASTADAASTAETESSGESSDDSSSETAATQPDLSTGGTGEPEVWFDDCPADEVEERFVDVGELSLNVACRGSGPTIVFLHGFPEFHYSWHSVFDELAGEYRLVAPDQRGFNISDKPEAVDDYHIDKLADDIVALLPLISEEPVLLVVHDWGGPVGWLAAHHESVHIRGLLAVNGPHPMRFAELIETDPAQMAASAYMDDFRAPDAETFITPESLALTFDFLTDEELARYTEAWSQPGAITGGLNWYRANELTIESMQAVMAGVEPEISVPVSVLWGLDDIYILTSNTEELEQFAPDIEIATIPNVDHWIEHRVPAQVAQAVRDLDDRAGG